MLSLSLFLDIRKLNDVQPFLVVDQVRCAMPDWTGSTQVFAGIKKKLAESRRPLFGDALENNFPIMLVGKWYDVIIALSELFVVVVDHRQQHQFRVTTIRGYVRSGTGPIDGNLNLTPEMKAHIDNGATHTRQGKTTFFSIVYCALIIRWSSLSGGHSMPTADDDGTYDLLWSPIEVQRTLVVVFLHCSFRYGLHKYLVIIKNSSKRQIKNPVQLIK